MVKSQRIFVKTDIFPYLTKIYLVPQLSFTIPIPGNHTGIHFRLLPPWWRVYCISETLVYKRNPIQMGKNTIPIEPHLPTTFCSNSADGVNVQRQGSSQHGLVI